MKKGLADTNFTNLHEFGAEGNLAAINGHAVLRAPLERYSFKCERASKIHLINSCKLVKFVSTLC